MAGRARRAFVAHDFSRERNHKGRFRRAIRSACARLDCRPVYADVHLRDELNLANIRKKILASDLCVVDVTNYHGDRRARVNLNAVFEYGMAEGAGKPTILFFRSGSLSVARDFSDVSGYLYEEYSSYDELAFKLRERLKSLLARLG